jgi:hypothetical protein
VKHVASRERTGKLFQLLRKASRSLEHSPNGRAYRQQQGAKCRLAPPRLRVNLLVPSPSSSCSSWFICLVAADSSPPS